MSLQNYLPHNIAGPSAGGNTPRCKILVVDDELLVCDIICEMLDIPGYLLETAVSAHEALEKAHSFNPDLVLLDIELKDDIDGIDVCRVLKKMPHTQETPVIFVTGSVDRLARGFEVGAADFIRKPIDYYELRARVRNQLKIRELVLTLRILNDFYEERLAGYEKNMRP